MEEIKVKDGQTLFDLALQLYGDISGYWWLLEDNHLNIESEIIPGQFLKVREAFIKDKALFFRNSEKEINNSDGFRFADNNSLSLTVQQVKNELYGNDGYIVIEVSGGKTPYGFLWSTGAITKNLLNASAGVYTVTVEDAKGQKLIQSLALGTDNTGNWLTEKKTGMPVTTKAGSKIRFKIYN
jgi:hypothetical protein